VGVASLSLIASIMLAYFLPGKVYTVMSYQLLLGTVLLIVQANWHLSRGYNLIQSMYQYHRFEYANHSKNIIALLLATYFSQVLLLVFCFFSFTLLWCLAGNNEEYPESRPFYSQDDDHYCGFFVAGFNSLVASKSRKSILTSVFLSINVIEMTPFLAFYLLDRPHDCFVCLGRDPDRIYSQMQLTLAERVQRKMFVKYSMQSSVALEHFEKW